MKYLKIIAMGVISMFAFQACNTTPEGEDSNQRRLTQLTNNEKAEKLALFLRLSEETVTDTSIVYIGKALVNEDTVGMKIEVLKNIPAGITAEGTPDQENGFSNETIRFSSIGAQSDALVKYLSDIFELNSSGQMTKETIQPLTFSSNKQPIELPSQGTYSFKLFLENKAGDEAEVFAVLDTYKSGFELTEKDASYRQNLLSALTGE